MKIQDPGRTQTIQADPSVSKENTPVQADRFAQLLDQELKPVTETVPDTSAALETVSLFMPNLWSVPESTGCDPAAQAVEGIESRLQGLERVERALQDPDVSLWQVDEALNALATEADRLQDQLSGLSEEHPLKQLGDELSVVSYVENVKWRRGDYL